MLRLTLRALCLLQLLLAAAGCETVGFYSQAVSGQLSVMHRRQPVADLLRDLDSADAGQQRLLSQLQLSREILLFAEAQLGVEVGRRYRTFVQLDEPYVLWNIFAAPELELTPRTWCYLLVGCAPYRGYFKRVRAEEYASKLRGQSFETFVGGVAAYSTLGWFSDPLLSSFIYWSEYDLAELLFHELAHTQVWVGSDVGFNEAFATFVGSEAARQFLLGRASPEQAAQMPSAWPRMLHLLLALRQELQSVYALDVADALKRERKQRAIALARACYAEHRDKLGSGRYDTLMERINNAYLVSLTTYRDAVPAFSRLFQIHAGVWADFFAAVKALGDLDPGRRAEKVAELRQQHEAGAGDDERPEYVQCETFPSHGLNRKPPGAEHNDIGRGGDR
jgi:predicted aminopeptidase